MNPSTPPTAPIAGLGLGRPGGLQPPPTLAGRFGICDVSPSVESGRRPVKASTGELLRFGATVFREGHDALAAEVVFTGPSGQTETRRLLPGEGVGRWECEFRFPAPGDWTFAIRAWHDPVATWRHRAEVKVPAGVDVDLELEEGAQVLERVIALLTPQSSKPAARTTSSKARSGKRAARASSPRSQPAEAAETAQPAASAAAQALRSVVSVLRDQHLSGQERLEAALTEEVSDLLAANPLRDFAAASAGWPVRVERARALFGSWYEMFPRSEGATTDPANSTATSSGSFATAAGRLPAIAAMGFDVVYLPPIHPIGRVNRKGRNNTLNPGAGDPGSPWAIGSLEGGHDAVHPDLGTLADFDAFVAAAAELDLEVALDFALQAAPDHPWAKEHPEWFTTRADGTIAFAENPPKKYQDIYPLNFDNDPEGLYAEVARLVRFWMARGIKIFRVDNPHTKPLWVWDRLTAEINAEDPEVIFLAEAFTKPPMMRALASVGFQQSYTYFTWRNHKQELTEYLEELSGPAAAYMRPNFFVNTPDILHEYLQHGGPGAFAIRATLAATMSPTWGMYAGFELFEHQAIAPGSEEYLESEKYQYRPRDWAAAGIHHNTLIPYVTLLNQIRRTHPALQALRNIHFHPTDSDDIIAFSKTDGEDTVIVICTLEPFQTRETTVWLDMPALGYDWGDYLVVTDEVSGSQWAWHQGVYVRLDPQVQVAHIARVHRP